MKAWKKDLIDNMVNAGNYFFFKKVYYDDSNNNSLFCGVWFAEQTMIFEDYQEVI